MNNTTYSTGSVSVAASGTTVTGSGTAWQSSGIRAGDLIMIAGLTAQIATVASNTSLTLKRAWPGAAQSGANYDIIMLDDEVRGLIAANALLQALSGGTLTSLGQIAGAANQMPYWTGTGVMGAADLTAEARSLLGSTLLSRSGNNLVTGALARITGGAVTQGNSDTTSGRLMTVGDWGLGAQGVNLQAADDLNANLLSGFYRWNSQAQVPANVPAGVLNGAMVTVGVGSTVALQLLSATGNAGVLNGRLFSRVRGVGGGADAWKRLLNEDDLSGSVNNGAIIERGSNANGEYVKFADGTMICWPAPVSATCDTAIGSIFTSPASLALPFPAAFAAPPRCLGSYQRTGGSISHWMGTISASNTTVSFRPLAATTGAVGDCHVMAFGRWF